MATCRQSTYCHSHLNRNRKCYTSENSFTIDDVLWRHLHLHLTHTHAQTHTYPSWSKVYIVFDQFNIYFQSHCTLWYSVNVVFQEIIENIFSVFLYLKKKNINNFMNKLHIIQCLIYTKEQLLPRYEIQTFHDLHLCQFVYFLSSVILQNERFWKQKCVYERWR